MELKASELRIGNKLFKHGVVVTIDGRSIFDMWSIDYSHVYYPVPLTEEWLFKFGFKRKDGREGWYQTNGKIDICDFSENKKQEYTFCPKMESKYLSVELPYVHTLQNLYFALVGEELQIKETAQ